MNLAALLLAAGFLLGGSDPARAAPAHPAAPGELLVRFERGVDEREQREILSGTGVAKKRDLLLPHWVLARASAGTAVSKLVARLEARRGVRDAEPNFLYRLTRAPDDPRFGELWGLRNVGQVVNGLQGTSDADIDAEEAWEVETGSRDVLVAVIDDGVDVSHPDLRPNIWRNPGEWNPPEEANGIDDDANGLTDDVHGWDFVSNDADMSDPGGARPTHGTHVAGTIGAVGNNGRGVSGVNWEVTLLPLKACRAAADCPLDAVVDAVAYSGDIGADIVNMSLGGPSGGSLNEAIATYPETLFVVSAGNDGANLDFETVYPCEAPYPHVICVAATDARDELASFSNYGDRSVDLAAPGAGILSAQPAYQPVWLDDFDGVSSNWDTEETAVPSEPPRWRRPADGGSGRVLSDSELTTYRDDVDLPVTVLEPIQLGATGGCGVEYALSLSTEPARDFLRLEIARDRDGPYTEVTRWSGDLGPTPRAAVTALDPSLTGDVYFRFRLTSDANPYAFNDGARIDDFAVRCEDPSLSYELKSGTSMATPHVAGAAALLKAAERELSATQLRDRIFSRVDPLPGLAEKTVTDGRLNLARTLADLTPPRVSITGTPPDTTRERAARFDFTADDQQARFECSFDRAEFASCTSPQDYSGIADGFHTFAVRAWDPAGNVSATQSWGWTVDTRPPRLILTQTPGTRTAQTSAQLSFDAEAGAAVECRLDDDAAASCTSPHRISGLSDGEHRIRVEARDIAGNTSGAEHAWTVDTRPPAVTITSGPAAASRTGDAEFRFAASEAVEEYRCRLVPSAPSPCRSPAAYTGLPDGRHVFEVVAHDLVGHRSAAASWTWSVARDLGAADILGGSDSTTSPAAVLGPGIGRLQAAASRVAVRRLSLRGRSVIADVAVLRGDGALRAELWAGRKRLARTGAIRVSRGTTRSVRLRVPGRPRRALRLVVRLDGRGRWGDHRIERAVPMRAAAGRRPPPARR